MNAPRDEQVRTLTVEAPVSLVTELCRAHSAWSDATLATSASYRAGRRPSTEELRVQVIVAHEFAEAAREFSSHFYAANTPLGLLVVFGAQYLQDRAQQTEELLEDLDDGGDRR